MQITMKEVNITHCSTNDCFLILVNDDVVHEQQSSPTETDVIEAVKSDRWKERFEEMQSGMRTRVSERIYYDMLGAVPPAKYTAKGFYCGEGWSGNLYYLFEKDDDGKYYGELKSLQ